MASEQENVLTNCKLCTSLLLKKGDTYFFHIIISKDIEFHANSSVLSVDLGERFSACAVHITETNMTAPKFYGKNIRGFRRHYAWLRKRLQKRKLLREIKRIGNTEQRKIQAILHKISRDIVNEAKHKKAIILLGDLKGIRKHARGKRMNRIVSNMSYYRLSKMIEHKASWEGIQVAYVNEAYTSKLCHICNNEGKRVHQGLFKCSICGSQGNADYNGAVNIGKRFMRNVLMNGVSGITLIRGDESSLSSMTTPQVNQNNKLTDLG